MSSAAPPEYPWRARALGDAVAAQRSALVLASYPVLLLLVVLAAFVRYLWIALAMYCALLFVLSCAARTFFSAAARTAGTESSPQVGHGGLSPAAISAVAPAFPYDAAGAGAGAGAEAGAAARAECSVCLEAIRGGEAARRLPACAHAFHAGCIDMWLDSHATCPVCRCHVLVPPRKGAHATKETPEPSPANGAPLPPV